MLLAATRDKRLNPRKYYKLNDTFYFFLNNQPLLLKAICSELFCNFIALTSSVSVREQHWQRTECFVSFEHSHNKNDIKKIFEIILPEQRTKERHREKTVVPSIILRVRKGAKTFIGNYPTRMELTDN